MSKLSVLLHKIGGDLRTTAGQAIVHEGAEFVIDNAEHYKAVIEAATRAYLTSKLGADLGPTAANLADMAVNALATVVEGAAHAVAGDPPPA